MRPLDVFGLSRRLTHPPIRREKTSFRRKTSQNPSSASGGSAMAMGVAPLDPSYKAKVPDFEQNLVRKVLRFRDRILSPYIGPDQGIELEPHGIEVETEAAVG